MEKLYLTASLRPIWSSRDKCVSWLVAFLIFSAFNPYFYWAYSLSPILKIMADSVFVITFFGLAATGYLKNIRAFLALPILILWAAQYFMMTSDPYYDYVSAGKRIFQIAFILLLNSKIIFLSGIFFGRILAFFGLATLVVWFAILFFPGLTSFFSQAINPYTVKESMGQNYISFGLGTYLDSQLFCYGLCTFRINGAFDEPGLWGTVCALYLAAFKLDLKTPSRKIIFISGCISFSFAFYLLILAAATLHKRLNIKFLLISISTVALLYTLSTEFFNQFIFDRIDTVFNSRTDSAFNLKIAEAYTKGQLIFGLGYGETRLVTEDASSWKVVLYDSGIVGLFLVVVSVAALYIFYCDAERSRYFGFVSCILLMMSFYQRPEIIWIGYLYILLFSFSIPNEQSKAHK